MTTILIKERKPSGFSQTVGMYDGKIHANSQTLLKMMQIALSTDVKWKRGRKKVEVFGDDKAWVQLKQKLHAPYWIKRDNPPKGTEFQFND